MTYTLENIPADIEQALRDRAAAEHKSLDATILDALARGLGVPSGTSKKRDLSFMANGPPLEAEVIRALEDQRKIDSELWK